MIELVLRGVDGEYSREKRMKLKKKQDFFAG
jgi:hypothetical protein